MQASVSFRVNNTDTTNQKKVALIPAHFHTEVNILDTTAGKCYLGYFDASHIVSAGYACDEVLSEVPAGTTVAKSGQKMNVTSNDGMDYSDFLNMLRLRPNCRITRIDIQNHAADSKIFDQKIEVRQTAIGSISGADFIRLQQFVSVNAYDRSKITIDMEQAQLLANAKTLMLLNLPASADFTITFYVTDEGM